MSVIVTNAKSRIAYNIVKSLGKKGIDVYSADFVPLSMSFASKYSKGYFIYPSPYSKQKEFINCLIEKIHKNNIDLLIPVHEETYLIAKYKDILNKHVKIVLSDYDKLMLMHNKDKWEEIAARLDVPMPPTYKIEQLRNNEELSNIEFPILIKPKQGGGAFGIKEINNISQLYNIIKLKKYLGIPIDRFFIQKKIIGEVDCVAMLFRNGNLLAKSTYKQLREFPISGGQATARKSVKNKKAEEYFERILTEVEWHGICQADFIIEKNTQIPYLIDINPRFFGSIKQVIESGIDLPFLVYSMANNKTKIKKQEHKLNIETDWLAGELRRIKYDFSKSKDKINFIKSFLIKLLKEDRFDDFDLKDPMPFFIWCFDTVYRMLKQKTIRPSPHESLCGIWK